MSVRRWRKRPVVIEAIRFTGTNIGEIWDAFGAGESKDCCVRASLS